MKYLDWHGVYRKGWKGKLVPDAFSHPAKVAFGLAEKIYTYAFECGYIHEGDTVLDPFGGIGGFALSAMTRGCHWTGVELEQKFVKLGNANIALWQSRYTALPRFGSARIVQGDSRRLGDVMAGVDCVVSSPPYSKLALVVGGSQFVRKDYPSRSKYADGPDSHYGESDGKLGQMKAGDFDAVVSSPPYESAGFKSDENPANVMKREAKRREQFPMRPSTVPGRYGDTYDNLGNQQGESFWSAALTIVQQCYDALKPNGIAVWVVKDFVRNKKVVPFGDQWRQLCESCGFETVEIARAWLVEDKGTQDAFDGNHKVHLIQKKSFFRRLAEHKGSPRVDYECVIFMRKKL